jgi:hypothetical protein
MKLILFLNILTSISLTTSLGTRWDKNKGNSNNEDNGNGNIKASSSDNSSSNDTGIDSGSPSELTANSNSSSSSVSGNSFAGTSNYYLHGLSAADQKTYISNLQSSGAKVVRLWSKIS